MFDPRQLALAALPLVFLAACSGDAGHGGGDEATDPKPYIHAAVASMTADKDLPFDEATATCVSTALVDVVGADALARAKVTPEEFANAESYDVLAVDVADDARAKLGKGLEACDTTKAFGSMFVRELGIHSTPEDEACIAGHLDRRALNDALADGWLGSGDASGKALEDAIETALLDAVIGCPRVVTATFLSGAPGTPTPETEACVSAVVSANPDRVRKAFGGDGAAADALGTEIGTRCAATLGA
ncbi:MAG TPA: hypothetical protein VKB57_13415 [Acidimicrobiales bacterium]|nr:hypothetical protein [Acidimicrobiales bacterium]